MAQKKIYSNSITFLKKTSLFILLLSLSACSVQKRKYQKGYYIDWAVNKDRDVSPKPKNILTHKSKAFVPKAEQVVIQDKNAEAKSVIPVVSPGSNKNDKGAENKQMKQLSDSCDRLLKRTGDEVYCKVKEITETEIVYKRCDMQDGPDYRIRKVDVLMVTYASGMKEKFAEEKPSPNTFKNDAPKKKTTKRDNDYALYSLIAGVAGFVLGIGSIPAIILGILALRQFKRNPDEYEGRTMAIVGIALGVIKLVLFFLIIALIFLTL